MTTLKTFGVALSAIFVTLVTLGTLPATLDDVQSPRSGEIRARLDDAQAPRGQDIQAPARPDDQQAPRGQDIQAPRA